MAYNNGKKRKKDLTPVTVQLLNGDVVEMTQDELERRRALSSALQSVVQFTDRKRYPFVETDEEVVRRIAQFFTDCIETGSRATIEKLSIALGHSVQEIRKWQQGSRGQKRQRAIQSAFDVIASADAELALNGDMNAILYIYRSKNFYNMSDDPQIVYNANTEIEASTSAQELADKYRDVVDVEYQEIQDYQDKQNHVNRIEQKAEEKNRRKRKKTIEGNAE